MSLSGVSIFSVTFTSSDSAPISVSVPGLKAGDVLLAIEHAGSSAIGSNWFEAIVSTDDHLYQNNGGAASYTAVFFRNVS